MKLWTLSPSKTAEKVPLGNHYPKKGKAKVFHTQLLDDHDGTSDSDAGNAELLAAAEEILAQEDIEIIDSDTGSKN